MRRSVPKVSVHSSNGMLLVTIVAPRDQLEQELGVGLGQRHEAQFVNDELLDVGHLFLEAQHAAFVARFHQIVDECRGGGETDRPALLAGGQPEPQEIVPYCFLLKSDASNPRWRASTRKGSIS